MNHQPLHSSDAFPQIPVVQTGGEFGYLVCKPGVRQERGGFLDPHSTKMARINRKKAMIRSRNNSYLNSSSNELVDSRRQVALTMKNNAEIAARKDFYRFSSFDNKVCISLVQNNGIYAILHTQHDNVFEIFVDCT